MIWRSTKRQDAPPAAGFQGGGLGGATAEALDQAAGAIAQVAGIAPEAAQPVTQQSRPAATAQPPRDTVVRAANDPAAPGGSGPAGGNGGNGGGAPGGPGGPGSGSPFSQQPPEGHAKKMSEVLGEVVWLMSQSPLHKQFFISDLEWFVMTPVLLQQFRLFYTTDRPIGVVLWASVSDEVAERLAQGTTKLRPQDWKSGDKLWVVEVIAPFGGAEEMVKDLKEKVFPAKEIHFLAVNKDGKQVRVV